MKQMLLILLVFTTATASAQVYRRIGPDGQVYFSDRPGPDAEQVNITPAPAVRLPPVSGQADSAGQPESGDTEPEGDTAPLYTEFTIVSPTGGQGVRANDGNVPVELSLQPQLEPGHTIALKIDGEDGEEITTGEDMLVELSNLSRGRHTIEATVIDDAGNELIQAGPVNFYVLRFAGGGG